MSLKLNKETKENQHLEFKKSLAEKREILETISAFANTAKRDLTKLVKLDLVEQIGIGRAVKYKGKT